MNEVIISALNFLLKKNPGKDQGDLFEKIPKTLAIKLKSAHPCQTDPFLATHSEPDLIHHSWITPFLRKLSENDMKLLLASLKPETASHIKSSLLLRSVANNVSPMAKEFFRNWIWQQLVHDNPSLLPIACLPQSELNDLLHISFQDIDLLIDLLAMHDMNIELKHIIETAKLKTIKQALSKEQLQYLNKLQPVKERVIFKRMNLSSWNGNVEVLQQLLRQRGLNRFAKALSHEDVSLVWYVKRRLNSEEQPLFDKLIHNLQNADATEALRGDLIQLLTNFPKSFFEEIA